VCAVGGQASVHSQLLEGRKVNPGWNRTVLIRPMDSTKARKELDSSHALV